MVTINPYLNFNGNTEEVFNFYKSVFGGDFNMVARFKEMPFDGMSEADGNKIMHISLPIGGDSYLMGSDVPGSMPSAVTGSNVNLTIHATTKEDADRIFNALSQGGNVTMPIGVAPWGAYFGMFTDKFGINWMVDHALEQ